MQRRDFLKAMGSTAFLAFGLPYVGRARAEEAKPGFDNDPIGGYVKRPPNAYLFTDHRLIRPNDLSWIAPDGKGLPLNSPPVPSG